MICTSLKIIFKSLKCKQLNFWKFKLKYQKDDKKYFNFESMRLRIIKVTTFRKYCTFSIQEKKSNTTFTYILLTDLLSSFWQTLKKPFPLRHLKWGGLSLS